MADGFEKTMPEFFKGKAGVKAFEITGAITLTLFIGLNSELNGLRTQISDLHRYSHALVDQDDRARRDAQLGVNQKEIRGTIEKSLKEWRATTERIEQATEQLTDDRDRTMQSLEGQIGDVRVRLAIMEIKPDSAPEPAKKNQPAGAPTKGGPAP